jgi:AbrB family looped-hinge helix DNA binding protein
MTILDVKLAESGQMVIPKGAMEALGLKPGSKLEIRIDGNQLVFEKEVALDLSRWVGRGVDDGLTRDEALTELRDRVVPWRAEDQAP